MLLSTQIGPILYLNPTHFWILHPPENTSLTFFLDIRKPVHWEGQDSMCQNEMKSGNYGEMWADLTTREKEPQWFAKCGSRPGAVRTAGISWETQTLQIPSQTHWIGNSGAGKPATRVYPAFLGRVRPTEWRGEGGHLRWGGVPREEKRVESEIWCGGSKESL